MQSGGERKQERTVRHTPAEAGEESCSPSLIRPHHSVALNLGGAVTTARDLALLSAGLPAKPLTLLLL